MLLPFYFLSTKRRANQVVARRCTVLWRELLASQWLVENDPVPEVLVLWWASVAVSFGAQIEPIYDAVVYRVAPCGLLV